MKFSTALLPARSFVGALILPPLLLVVAMFIAPLAMLLYVSFMTPSTTELFGHKATLDNYLAALSDEFILLVIQRTLLSAAVILGACLMLGYPVAMVVARMRPRWRLVMLMVLLFPLMVTNVVRAYGWLAILGREGVINVSLSALGMIPYPLRMLNTFEAVVLALLTILLPYMIISVANTLASIDPSYEEAAQSLGAGPSTHIPQCHLAAFEPRRRFRVDARLLPDLECLRDHYAARAVHATNFW